MTGTAPHRPPGAVGRAAAITELIRTGEVVDLAQAVSPHSPVFPLHHRYSLLLHRRHGDTPRASGATFANELIVTTAHVGTHIDALGHFSRDGHAHGGVPVDDLEGHEGLAALDAAAIPLLVGPAVLLDVAATRGGQCLEPGDAIESDDLDAAAGAGREPRPGDVVLVRTGWSRHWGDPPRFNGEPDGYPGIGATGAEWIADHGITAAGTDTPGFEVAPSCGVSVHARLLVDAGIYLVENLALDELARRDASRFLFVALPLKLTGATGSPLRPIAIL